MLQPKGIRKESRISVSFDSDAYAVLRDLARCSHVSVLWLMRHAERSPIIRDRQILGNSELLLSRRALHRAGRQ
jgi:hypothetical protein